MEKESNLKNNFRVFQLHKVKLMYMGIFFMFMWSCIITNFFTIKPTRCTNFTHLFCHGTLHVSDSSSVHHQAFIHRTLSSGICHTGLETEFEQDHDGPARKMSTNLYDIYHCWVYSEKTHDDWQTNCPKHVVSWQNKFVKLVHLFGFITK